MVERGELSEGHARAVLAVPDHGERRRFARKIVAQGMSVRAAERAARWSGARTKPRTKTPVDPALAARVKQGLAADHGPRRPRRRRQGRARLRRRARPRGARRGARAPVAAADPENRALTERRMLSEVPPYVPSHLDCHCGRARPSCCSLPRVRSARISSAADFPTLLVTFQTSKTVTVTLTDRTPVGTSSGAADDDLARHLQHLDRRRGVRVRRPVASLRAGREARDQHVLRRGAVGDLGRDVPAELDVHLPRRQSARDGVHVRQTTSTALVGTQGNGQAPLTLDDAAARASKNGKATSTDVVGSASRSRSAARFSGRSRRPGS